MPARWFVGTTDTGPRPNQPGVPSEIVTGEKATESSDANVRVLEKLTDEGIEIITINQGAGKLNLLIGVPEERYEDAIRAVYKFRQQNTPKKKES